VTKREFKARQKEFLDRGCPREWLDIILDLEESCDRLRKKIRKHERKIRSLEAEIESDEEHAKAGAKEIQRLRKLVGP